jgi:secondary thiamine-phosphate synthase enzyme
MAMRQKSRTFLIETRGQGFTDVTDYVRRFVSETGIATGVLTVFIQHTSASLLIQENADPDVLRDLNDALDRPAPARRTLSPHHRRP